MAGNDDDDERHLFKFRRSPLQGLLFISLSLSLSLSLSIRHRDNNKF